MKKCFFIGLIGITIISCAPSIAPIAIKSREINNVELNKNLRNDIGDVLIEKGKEENQDAVELVECPTGVTFNLGMINYPYKTGDILPLSGSYENWDLYSLKDKDQSSGTAHFSFGIAISKKDPTIVRMYQHGTNGFIVKDKKELSIKPATYSRNCKECFKQEFIFNGKVDNNLKFIYREYISDFARPAFTQELQYDLNESNVIGFKGLRIEIIKVTNTSIQYKVLSTFSNR